VDPVGDVTIEGIAFRGAGSGVYLVWGANPTDDIPDTLNVVIRRNIFAGAGSADDQGISLVWLPLGPQTLSARLVENLVHGNGDGSGTACSGSSPVGAHDHVAERPDHGVLQQNRKEFFPAGSR
jgi:hypothetical protein